MKNTLVLLLTLVLITPAWADLTLNTKNKPEGVFKKTRNGDIVQIDKHGKKIGVYKVIHGKYIKVK